MSVWHPLWAPPNSGELRRGAQLLAAASDLEASEREKDYISALQLFFADTNISRNRSRAAEYAKAMNEMYKSYRDEDINTTVFYALSLLGSADPRDKSYQNQFKSGALLKFAQQSQPTHPGVLHYIIHSYDFPGLAHLALDDARNYASAAPDSAHAQHMPSHIFTRLGLWDLSLASNHDSTHSAAAYTESANLPGHYDEGLHSMDYLMYAMLQTGRDTEALELLTRLNRIERTDTENFKVAFTYASSRARYTLERRAWEEASQIDLMRPDFAWEEFPWAESIHHFARGIGAARSGDIKQAKNELARIQQLHGTLSEAAPLYWRVEVMVQADSVKSWILLLEGNVTMALELALKAANDEDTVDKHPVTPGEVLPARELYADMLLQEKRYSKALTQYQAVLTGSPNRLNALIGAARAAKASGKEALAQGYKATVQKQTKSGSRELSILAAG